MKLFRRFLALFLALAITTLTLAACKKDNDENDEPVEQWKPNAKELDISSDSLYVQKVEGLDDEFIFGMDASAVPSLEAGGVKYYDHNGAEKDVYQILSENGINYIRVLISLIWSLVMYSSYSIILSMMPFGVSSMMRLATV